MSSGCGDVLSLEDLKTAEKHQIFEAEVITGLQGGVAGGASIDYATNQVTGQTQKTLPAILRDAGFDPASFDFSTGGTLSSTDRDKVVFDPVSKIWYAWVGALPKTIPAGTNPLLDANWRPQTYPDLREELASTEGMSLIGTPGGDTLIDLHKNDMKAMWGAVADYTGTPLYDGNDASRITYTNNTPALQSAVNSATLNNGALVLYFPEGHYGFSGDGVTIDSTARPDIKSILLIGAGMDRTTIDYVREKTDISGGAQKDTAVMLFRVNGIPVYVSNIYTKCTTKSGVVNGSTLPNPDNPDVYNGAVWFMHVQDAAWVVTENVRMSHANYRGFSVDAEGLPIGSRTEWTITNCIGHDNASTGFWGNFNNAMLVKGGKFYHNGTKGLLGTGYGFAASQYVDRVLADGCLFYENYRKGVDRHGGVGTMVITNCTFADNLLRDIEDNKQYNAQYPVAELNSTSISGNTFLLNRNPVWLKEALDAVAAAGGSASCSKSFVSILDRLIAGTIAGKQSRIDFANNTVKVMGNVPDGYQGFGAFNFEAPTTNLDGNVIDTTGFRFADGVSGNVYQSYWASSVHDNAVIRFRNNFTKTHPGSINHPASGEASNSVFLHVQPTTVVEQFDSTFELINFIPYGMTGGGNISAAPGLTRKGYNSTWIFRNLRLRTQNQTTTNSFTWVSGSYGVKGTSGNDTYQNCYLGYGDAKTLSPLNTFGGMGCKQAFQINGASRPVGSTTPILSAVLGGNLHVALQGALELNADQHRSGFRYSAFTQTVYTGSSYIAFERVGTEALTYNGATTNFIATKFQVRFAVASPSDTGFYNGELSCNDWSASLIVG